MLDFNFTLFQNQILANDPLPNILDVLYNSLEVTCGIVRTGDEDVVRFAVRNWGIDGRNRNESRGQVVKPTAQANVENNFILLVYGSEKLETWDDLLLRAICLDNRADYGHVYVLGADIVR